MNDLKANRLKVSKLLHAALLAAVTFFIIYQSIYSMRANAWYFNARNTLQLLATSQNTETVLVTAKQAMILATELDPRHPHYWQLYAHITLLRLSAGNTQDDVIKNQLLFKQAEQALLKSVELRQAWAETWITLARVVSYQEGASDRVFSYIQHAKKVGPYKFDVHLGAIHIALMNWSQLTPQFKALYVNELTLAVKFGYRFNQVFSFAKQVNALPILCLSLQFGNAFEQVKTTYHYKKHCGS